MNGAVFVTGLVLGAFLSTLVAQFNPDVIHVAGGILATIQLLIFGAWFGLFIRDSLDKAGDDPEPKR